ncbi:MAG TPA: CoA transferase [Candidatus Binataceae bacterium]|jgi:CoA:oxalate CoA-transferase
MAEGPFSDITVIDLTHVLSGPYCTMYLAELGARVIKVEHAGHGDETRHFPPLVNGTSAYFATVNRGKESIALEFEKKEDKELLLEMIRRADVVVENLRYATLEHLGLDYEALRRINPRLIYAAISAFGQTGPMHERCAYDPILQAMSGMMTINGQPGSPPTKVGTSMVDYFSGMFCLAGIEAALYNRTRTGEGAKVDIGMLDVQMAVLESALMNVLNGGPAPQAIGNRHPAVSPCDSYSTSDRPIIIISGNDDTFRRLCGALGRPQIGTDPRFLTNPDRKANEAALKAAIEEALRGRTATQWESVLAEAGIPCAVVGTVTEAVNNPQLRSRNMILNAGEIRMAGNPIKISTLSDPPARKPAPKLDADGARIRAEFAPGK